MVSILRSSVLLADNLDERRRRRFGSVSKQSLSRVQIAFFGLQKERERETSLKCEVVICMTAQYFKGASGREGYFGIPSSPLVAGMPGNRDIK